eukprot:m.170699 g.170699  ORF g.170699 m.170699 type:complete len:106 (-) comp24210_c0_seq5:14-331(-)
MLRMADCAVQLLYDDDFKRQCYRAEWQVGVGRCAKILELLVLWGHADGLLTIWANGYDVLYAAPAAPPAHPSECLRLELVLDPLHTLVNACGLSSQLVLCARSHT